MQREKKHFPFVDMEISSVVLMKLNFYEYGGSAISLSFLLSLYLYLGIVCLLSQNIIF